MTTNRNSKDMAVTVVALGIFALTAFTFWLSHSPWSFMCLFLLVMLSEEMTIETRCPKCDHSFTAVKKGDDEDN